MEQDLSRKYRPQTWDAVVGQDVTIKSLRAILKREGKRSFLFVGDSGLGKTTVARILAAAVGCESQNLVEVDAATNTGIDAMRAISNAIQFKAFGKSKVKAVIIDECHQISRPGWQSLLKIVEEPPPHAYWIFCTTEAGKVPKTIVTRCATFTFSPVKAAKIYDLLVEIAEQEKYECGEDILDLISRKCYGSPRQALTYLAQCCDCKTIADAKQVMQHADDSGDIINVCRELVRGGLTWAKLIKLLAPIKDQNAESMRLVITAYLTKVLMGSKSDDQAARVLEMLDCFSDTYNSSEGFAPLLLSFGRLILAD
jgi:DNA polymerase III gamma/tau subunit